MKKIKVLQLIHNLKREGAQAVVYNLAIHIDSKQINTTICPWKTTGSFVNQLTKNGFEILVPPNNNPIMTSLWLARMIREQEINLIHAHMSDSALIALISSHIVNIPFLISFHSNRLMPTYGFLKELIYRPLFKLAVKRSSMNIAVSSSVMKEMKKQLDIEPNKLKLIQNGVSVTPFQAVSDQRNKRQQKDIFKWPHIISVGRLTDIKGQKQLIQTVPKLIKHFPNIQISIVGEGEDRSKLVALCKKLRVSQYVLLPGVINTIPKLLEQSDLFVSTSHYEGLPIAVIEAMGFGVPVVASDVPGNNDVIINGKTGLTYHVDDIDGLYMQIMRVLNNRVLYNQLSWLGHQSCEQYYSAKVMAQKYTSAYCAIIEGKKDQTVE